MLTEIFQKLSFCVIYQTLFIMMHNEIWYFNELLLLFVIFRWCMIFKMFNYLFVYMVISECLQGLLELIIKIFFYLIVFFEFLILKVLFENLCDFFFHILKNSSEKFQKVWLSKFKSIDKSCTYDMIQFDLIFGFHFL